MGEISLEGSTVSKFISSLSKSIQALCHGCMDFDTSIEMVGYININIDSGNVVDCVLNEKVRKSTANSITCISNSFHAKKDKPKQTKDASCSPVRHIDHGMKRPHGFMSRDFSSRGSIRKKQRHIPKPVSSPHDYYSSSETAYQQETASAYSEQPGASPFQPPNLETSVKTEYQEDSTESLDPSASSSIDVSVKKESDTFINEQSDRQETYEEAGSSGKNSLESKVKDHSNESFSDSYRAENSSEMAVGSSNFQPELRTEEDSSTQESSFFGAHSDQYAAGYSQGQEEEDDSQLEVIEIGDDDEDMQGFFDQSGTENVIGHHIRTPGMVYPWSTGYTPSEYLTSRRERNMISSRLYRLNRSNEQIERERHLARLRQRRRRAKLKAQRGHARQANLQASYHDR